MTIAWRHDVCKNQLFSVDMTGSIRQGGQSLGKRELLQRSFNCWIYKYDGQCILKHLDDGLLNASASKDSKRPTTADISRIKEGSQGVESASRGRLRSYRYGLYFSCIVLQVLINHKALTCGHQDWQCSSQFWTREQWSGVHSVQLADLENTVHVESEFCKNYDLINQSIKILLTR
jgi:hypothetical protein